MRGGDALRTEFDDDLGDDVVTAADMELVTARFDTDNRGECPKALEVDRCRRGMKTMT